MALRFSTFWTSSSTRFPRTKGGLRDSRSRRQTMGSQAPTSDTPGGCPSTAGDDSWKGWFRGSRQAEGLGGRAGGGGSGGGGEGVTDHGHRLKLQGRLVARQVHASPDGPGDLVDEPHGGLPRLRPRRHSRLEAGTDTARELTGRGPIPGTEPAS